MIRVIDRVNAWLGLAAGWLFFATGTMLTYEVTARYLFNAPTIWAEELSRLLLIWGTYFAMARLLSRREHIRITMILQHLGPRGLRLAEALSLLFIAAFCLVTAWYGTDIAADSFVRGRSTGTMLNIPNWWSEAVIPIAFVLLFLQSLAELVKLARGNAPPVLDTTEGVD